MVVSLCVVVPNIRTGLSSPSERSAAAQLTLSETGEHNVWSVPKGQPPASPSGVSRNSPRQETSLTLNPLSGVAGLPGIATGSQYRTSGLQCPAVQSGLLEGEPFTSDCRLAIMLMNERPFSTSSPKANRTTV